MSAPDNDLGPFRVDPLHGDPRFEAIVQRVMAPKPQQ